MNQERLERIRLLSARFHELQGLRIALFGASLTVAVGGYLLATPAPTNQGAIVAMLVSCAPSMAGMLWLNRYYATTFGRQVVSPPRHAKLFLVCYMALSWVLHHAVPSIPTGGPTIAIVAVFSMWVAIRDWPWRAYYLGIPAIVGGAFIVSAAASDIATSNPDLTLAMLFVALGASMVPIGLSDHALLVKLSQEAREAGLQRDITT